MCSAKLRDFRSPGLRSCMGKIAFAEIWVFLAALVSLTNAEPQSSWAEYACELNFFDDFTVD